VAEDKMNVPIPPLWLARLSDKGDPLLELPFKIKFKRSWLRRKR